MTRPPVPDIATLRTICHAGKLSKDSRFFYALSRRISIYITWLLLHTDVRPNQVTVVTVLLALVGVCLLAAGSPWVAMGGTVFLLGHYFLDKVDGDLARFYQKFSLVGVYLDDVGHSIVYGGIFLGLGLHLARHANGQEAALWALGAGALGALLFMIGKQSKSSSFTLFARNVLTQPELVPTRRPESLLQLFSREATHRDRGAEGKGSGGGAASLLSRARDTFLWLSDYTVILGLVIVGLGIELVTGNTQFLMGVLYFQVLVQAMALLGLIWVNSTVNIEAECLRLEAMIQRRHDADGNP